MAVVRHPFLSTDARGSALGLTSSWVLGGNVMKRKARPSTKYEPNQNRARSILGWLSRQWGELTDDQRSSWGAWALDHPGVDKFGDPFIMSGFNAYVQLNHNAVRLDNGAAMQVLPPEDPPASAVDVLTVAAGAGLEGDVDLGWTELGTGIADDFWEVQVAGPFISKGRKSVESRFAFRESVAGNIMLLTVDGLDLDMWYWFRVRYMAADGQVTAWHVGQATPKVGI